MTRIRDCVATRALERFGMDEDEYLRSRVMQGYSARRIGKEIGFSTTSIAARLRKRGIAESSGTVWVTRGHNAA